VNIKIKVTVPIYLSVAKITYFSKWKIVLR